MAYTKTVWQNNSLPALDETALNKMEQGIKDSHTHIDSDGKDHSDVGLNNDHRGSSHAPSSADNTSSNETSHADVIVDGDIGVTVQAYDAELEAGAEVNNISDIDAISLTDGGETDTHIHIVLDENDMASNSPTRPPSQQSVKAYAKQSFNTVAAMVASTTLLVGDTVRTLGYYVPGDGGGNDYSIVAAGTGTEDLGKYINLDTHQALGLFIDGIISIRQFGAKSGGIFNNEFTVQNSLTAYKDIFIPEGVFLVDGPYDSLSGLEMQTGQHISGAGINSVLLQGTVRFLLTAGTGDGGTTNPDDNKKGIMLDNFTLKNSAGILSQQKHLLVLSAVSGCTLTNMNFIGSQGDGIYIGSGTSGAAERHNRDITIQNCSFDGVNNQNRNGVSVIDCDGLTVRDCKFVNYSDPTMPGPIDVEPNDSYNIVKDILIDNCKFITCKGASAFGLYITHALAIPPKSVQVVNNYIDSACVFAGASLRLITAETLNDDTPLMGFVIENNHILSSAVPIECHRVRGAMICHNTIEGGSIVAIGKATEVAETFLDVIFSENILRNSGNSVGMLMITSGRRLTIENNIFSKPLYAVHAITFSGSGVTTLSSYISITGNRFIKSAIQTTIVYAASHTFADPETNKFNGNIADGSLLNTLDWPGKLKTITSFTNSFVGVNVKYRRSEDGIVYLDGQLNDGAGNLDAFVLPVGYRPSATGLYAINANDAFGQLFVGSDGTVRPRVGAFTAVSLTGVNFKAA